MAAGFGVAFGRLVKEKRGKLKISGGNLGALVFTDRENQDENVLKQDVSMLERGKIPNPHTRVVEAYRRAFETLGNPITDEEMAKVRSVTPAVDEALFTALVERNAALGRELHLKDTLIEGIVRRYTPGDWQGFDAALAQIEAVMRREAETRARPRTNLPGPLEDLRAALQQLNDNQQFDEGQEAVNRAIAEEKAIGKARLSALYSEAIDQARRRNDPATAVDNLVEQLRLAAPPNTLFNAIRNVAAEWYERGHRKGLRFDLEVALAVGRISFRHARGGEIAEAHNDLAQTLMALASQEISADKNREAISHFKSASRFMKRRGDLPNWAAAENNLGAAYKSLADRTGGIFDLLLATHAYENALTVWSPTNNTKMFSRVLNNLAAALRKRSELEGRREHIDRAVTLIGDALALRPIIASPDDWAFSQNNLGNILLDLERYERNPATIQRAIEAHKAALTVWLHDAVPLNWAKAKNNLGLGQQALGEMTSRFDLLIAAETSFEDALTVRTEAKIPYKWARTTKNLAYLAVTQHQFNLSQSLLQNAKNRAIAARAIFLRIGNQDEIASCDSLLARIAALEAGGMTPPSR